MTGRDALLAAFDELYDAALTKLDATATPEERASARAQFERRFSQALEVTAAVDVPGMPEEAIDEMKDAIASLSKAELAGLVATVPLAQRAQQMVRAVAMQTAQQRMLEHLAAQADTRWGN
ncbi:MAG: hypothetical protein KIT14_20575 [bacterium]|nr:hypothetical protein [bacterium]